MTRARPGAQRLELADGIVVTALNEGGVPGKTADYLGRPADEIEAALTAAGQEVPPNPDLSVLLIEAGRRILVDAGEGDGGRRGPGSLTGSLALVGLHPGAIDAVFLTHLHGDHYSGLVDTEGGARFPNASIYTYKQELDHAGGRDDVRRCLAPYAGRVIALAGTAWLPAVSLRPLPGHTPGHCGLTIGTDPARRLQVVGDLLHLPELQLGGVPVTTRYDWDAAMALDLRRSILSAAADSREMLMGMHFRWPSIRRVSRTDGAFLLVPVSEAQLIEAPRESTRALS